MDNLKTVIGALAGAAIGTFLLVFVIFPLLLAIPAAFIMVLWGALASGLGWTTIGYGSAFFASWLLVIAGGLFNLSNASK